jgi:hypothetical protein
MLKDYNVPIEAVSEMLGHSSTLTTEKHYARMRNDAAFDLVNRALGEPQVPTVPEHEKKPVIEPKGSVPGYA